MRELMEAITEKVLKKYMQSQARNGRLLVATPLRLYMGDRIK